VFECGICYADKLQIAQVSNKHVGKSNGGGEAYTKEQCGHLKSTCAACLRTYLEGLINERRPLCCLEPGCKRAFYLDDVKALFGAKSRELVLRYEERRAADFKQRKEALEDEEPAFQQWLSRNTKSCVRPPCCCCSL